MVGESVSMKIFVKEDFKVKEVQVEILCQKRDEAIEDLIERIQDKPTKIVGYKEGNIYPIESKKIFYVETVDNKLFIYLEKEVVEARYKLYQMEEILKERCFMRCNKSTIINIAKIEELKAIEGRCLLAVMENGEEIYISRSYARKLKEVLGG